MALNNLGHVLGGIFALSPLLLLPFLDPADVDKRNENDLVRIATSSSRPEG